VPGARRAPTRLVLLERLARELAAGLRQRGGADDGCDCTACKALRSWEAWRAEETARGQAPAVVGATYCPICGDQVVIEPVEVCTGLWMLECPACGTSNAVWHPERQGRDAGVAVPLPTDATEGT